METGNYLKCVMVASFVCISPMPTVFGAENGVLPAGLERRKKLYEQKIETVTKPVMARYRRDLDKMIDGYTRARDLDASLAVSAELKKLDGAGETAEEAVKEDPTEPLRLVELRQRYADELHRVQAPVREQYERDLQVMVKDFTRSRELEAAVAVRSELERIELLRQSSDPDGLGMWLQKHILVWKGQSGFVEISFDQRNAKVSADGRELMERPYTIKGEDTVEFDWSANDTNSFTLSKDRSSFVRKSSTGTANHDGEVKRR